MAKIAGNYDYQDPRDPLDSFDRFERPDYEPRDRDGISAERGQPFTEAEICSYLERGGAITICPTPVRPEPKPRGLNKMQEAWALTFDPLAGLNDAMAICQDHLNLIRLTSSRDRDKVARIKNTIKGILSGLTFADVAAEMSLDPAFLSRTMADAYARWPRLQRPLTFINLLNNQARRKCGELSTAWQFALRMGKQKVDDGVLIWGSWSRSGPQNHVAEPDHVVKLAELQHKAFPPIASNFNTAIASIASVARKGDAAGEVTWESAPSRGSQRTERIHYDRWGYETERTDGSVRIGAFKDRFGGIDAWLRLREHAGLPDKYFHKETRGMACIWPLPDVDELRKERALWAMAKRFSDERWLAANYSETGDAVFDGNSFTGLRTALERHADKLSVRPYPFITDIVLLPEPQRYKAPYVPFVSECKPGKRQRIRPSKYPAKAISYWGKKLRAPRFAKQVHNGSTYGPDANKQFLKIPGVKEPNPGWTSADVCVHPMVRAGKKWKRGRIGKRCMPTNSSLSSLPPLTRFFQFPLLPWEPEYGEYFNTPGLRPNRPPDAVNVSGFRRFI